MTNEHDIDNWGVAFVHPQKPYMIMWDNLKIGDKK
jgi:hypothetical protein